MRVYLQVIDKITGIYQTGMINEPVVKGKEVENALKHFGVSYGTIEWEHQSETFKYGKIEGTSKIISIVIT